MIQGGWTRILVGFLVFTATCMSYILRVSFNMAVVTMTDMNDTEKNMYCNNQSDTTLRYFFYFYSWSSNSVISPSAIYFDPKNYVSHRPTVNILKLFPQIIVSSFWAISLSSTTRHQPYIFLFARKEQSKTSAFSPDWFHRKKFAMSGFLLKNSFVWLLLRSPIYIHIVRC